MESERADTSLPAFARDVLSLFREQLAEVQFGDLDLALLDAHASALYAAQREVERIEAELAAARDCAAQRSQALMAVAQRALSYARIYAESTPELLPRVAEIAERRGGVASDANAPKKRGRPRKGDEAGLFAQVEGEADGASLM